MRETTIELEALARDAELVTSGRTITEADVVSFASLTGDFHPQHADAAWAAESRFGERIAHGMLVVSYAVGLMRFDPERVVALRGLESVTFKRPVRIGDTIRVRSRIADVRRLDPEHALVTLGWRIVNQDGATVARVTAQALWRIGAANPNGSGGSKKGEARAGELPEGGDSAAAPPSAAELAALYGERVLL